MNAHLRGVSLWYSGIRKFVPDVLSKSLAGLENELIVGSIWSQPASRFARSAVRLLDVRRLSDNLMICLNVHATGPAYETPSRDAPMVEAIERSKLRDVVADRLKNFILDENLSSGDRLPTETELAAKFGVSRLSLREATKSLEFLGIVEAKPGRGLTVGSVNMERVTEYLGFHPALHDVCPHELIDTRVLIEAGVIPHVARRMKQDSSIYDRLNAINAEFNQARSLTRWVELDIAFHRELVCASGLSPLMAFSDLLAVFFRRFRESLKKAEWSDGINGHQEIIDALQAGRIPEAEQAVRTHIECHRERMGLPPR